MKCHYCEKPAVVYCDFPLKDVDKSCDRPICRGHREKVGHVCFRGRNKKLSDTIDYCREHGEKP